MNWLALAFALELGLVPSGSFMMYEREPQVFEYDGWYYYPVSVQAVDIAPIVYTQLDARLWAFGIFYAGGGVRIQTRYHEEVWSFEPQATFYEFVGGLRYGKVQVQYRHCCMHPQMTYMIDYRPAGGWEGSYDEVSIRFGGLDTSR